MATSLPVYIVGEYSVFGQPVRLWGTTFVVPFLGVELPFLQSIFANPNNTGLLAFAGTVCAVVATHRASLDAPVSGVTALAGVLAAVNGLALLLSYSRTSWLAAAVSLGIYVASVQLCRDRLPHAVLAASGSTALFLLAVFR